MTDFSSKFSVYARNMGFKERSWLLNGVFELSRMQDAQHQAKGYFEGSRPTQSLFSMPEGFEMREWDKEGGTVVGGVIYVPSNKETRPYIEAHELGHAFNLLEGGTEKGIDELQACLRGGSIIANSKYDYCVYWDMMWHCLRVYGVQLTWDGYVFSCEPGQVTAAQFAWSVANGDMLLATPMACALDA